MVTPDYYNQTWNVPVPREVEKEIWSPMVKIINDKTEIEVKESPLKVRFRLGNLTNVFIGWSLLVEAW